MKSSRLRMRTNPPENLDEAKRLIAECIEHQNQRLSLSGLGLRRLPEEVGSLTWLTALDLRDNLISELPEFIGKLMKLESLTLSENPLRLIPEELYLLTNLRSLSISHVQPSAVSSTIGQLVNLTTLNLDDLELDKFPDWILNLKNLKGLSLEGNRLKELPDSIGELSELEILALRQNELKELPLSLRGLKELRSLIIDPIVGIPSEIITVFNAHQILDYYARVKGKRQPINEFKLILVGQGGVGKTTLVHRLTKNKYKEFRRTPGINITKWPVQIENDQVHAHIWDFGGQEIMHGTHRFFMTERALYLVLISGREGTEDHAEYWLSLVRSFAGFADVLPNRSYPKAVHPYLLALMRKFQLCHPLDDKGEKYLIPELLTKEEPELLDKEFPPDKCLGFEYRYDTVLPEGLLPRFIVETYFLREPKLVWRTGAVLERANCRALVRGDVQGRQVVIRVTGVGNGQRELLGIIREHFERIHRSFEKLPVTELVRSRTTRTSLCRTRS